MKKEHLAITGAVLVLVAVAVGGCCTRSATQYTRSTGEVIDDRTISRKVHAALKDDSLLGDSELEVSSFRGDVVVSGFVDHPAQRQRVSEVTRSVTGVHWFQNQTIVKGGTPYARMAASVTNSAYTTGMVNVWQRGALDHYGKPPAASGTMTGSQRSPAQDDLP